MTKTQKRELEIDKVVKRWQRQERQKMFGNIRKEQLQRQIQHFSPQSAINVRPVFGKHNQVQKEKHFSKKHGSHLVKEFPFLRKYDYGFFLGANRIPPTVNGYFSYNRSPEAVLKRAQEFISVGKDNDALSVLREIIKDRRHKQWSPTHELIMLRHLELCVKLRDASIAKDAFYQYKTLTQEVAVSSFENVIRHFLNLAEDNTEVAQKESIEKIEEIDDLDSNDAPETLLLSVVSGVVSKDRMDHTVLSPWLRFLWDSYRGCLDLLRNNSLFETLYHQIARQSFGFCIKYQRRDEFRKLCDLLRLHLSQLQKNINSHNTNNQRINLAESLPIIIETSLIKLDTAVQMELWQEAYRSSEDLHNLMQLGKEKELNIERQCYVNYYDKLSLIFWKGGNFLFHSAALLQKFTICKDIKKTFSGGEATEQATRLLLAALSISDDFDTSSLLTKYLDMEDMHINNVRVFSMLLRLPIAPTRKGILREIALLSVPDISQESVSRLYRLMEVDFKPLEAAKMVNAELDKIKALGCADYTQYIEGIRAVITAKTIKQLSNIYDAMPMDRMTSIIPFYNRFELEHFLIHITKQRFLEARVDHREKCIRFGSIDATIAGDVEAEFGETTGYKSEYEAMRVHLTRLYDLLGMTVYELDEKEICARVIEQFNRHRQTYEYHKDSDHERIMQRKKIIELHKENKENLIMIKYMEAQKIAADKDEKKRKEEQEKLKRKQEKREKKRKLDEREIACEKDRRRKFELSKKEEKEHLEQEALREKEAEREERQAARGRGREQRDYDRHGEPGPESKAETDNQWRGRESSGNVQHRRPPPPQRTGPAPIAAAAREPIINGESEQASTWRGAAPAPTLSRENMLPSQPTIPRAPPAVVEADKVDKWHHDGPVKPSPTTEPSSQLSNVSVAMPPQIPTTLGKYQPPRQAITRTTPASDQPQRQGVTRPTTGTDQPPRQNAPRIFPASDQPPRQNFSRTTATNQHPRQGDTRPSNERR